MSDEQEKILADAQKEIKRLVAELEHYAADCEAPQLTQALAAAKQMAAELHGNYHE